jgi:hypothetical protein
MQLSPAAFDGFLGAIGQQMLWRQASVCPCFNPVSGAAKPSCPVCSGKGRVWAAAVAGMAGFAGQKAKVEFAQLGLWTQGDIVLTIPESSALYALGQFDRVVMQSTVLPFSLNLTRGSGDVLPYTQVVSVAKVFWLSTDGTTIIPGGIPTVGAGGVLTWPTGQTPPPSGAQYSISGTYAAEYYAPYELGSNRNFFSGARLPRKMLMRLWDLFGR